MFAHEHTYTLIANEYQKRGIAARKVPATNIAGVI
jgi:hypothetical protein